MPNGDLLHNPWTDSHEDLVRLFKLNDSSTPGNDMRFARVEFSASKTEDMADVSKYALNIDEPRRPGWFTDEMEAKTIDKLKLIVSGMIISGDADLLCGGVYILAKGAKVDCVKACKIHVMLGDSNVGEMWGSSKVGVMRESSKVGVMWGSSKVGVMRESSKVGVMRESSKVGEMWESSKVGVMRESSKVGVMWGSSKVGVMRESSKVGVMRGSSKVGVMRESSKVEKGTDGKPKTA